MMKFWNINKIKLILNIELLIEMNNEYEKMYISIHQQQQHKIKKKENKKKKGKI